ncbi:MAG: bactofilin family protein [Helicobacteraceae bacterium]
MAVDTSGTTVIAEGTKIDGKIEITSKLHVDGEIDGTVHSKSIVTIGSRGVVKGEIYAEKLIVSGRFDGNADCKEIDILSGGKIVGDLLAANLVIESKGFFEGSSKVKLDADPIDID